MFVDFNLESILKVQPKSEITKLPFSLMALPLLPGETEPYLYDNWKNNLSNQSLLLTHQLLQRYHQKWMEDISQEEMSVTNDFDRASFVLQLYESQLETIIGNFSDIWKLTSM